MSALVAPVAVSSAVRLSPSFVRLSLASPALAELGVDGPWFDQRVKVVLGGDPELSSLDAWLEADPAERGTMRTYTLREVVGSGPATEAVIDVVVHDDGCAGPGAQWALGAQPGTSAVLVAPRRGHEFGGIEFRPTGGPVLLVGDESAVPAVAGILRDLPRSAVGSAYLEVPCGEDVQPLDAPPGVRLTWLVRPPGSEVGTALVPAVRAWAGLPPSGGPLGPVDPDLWETPVWSSSGEALPDTPRRAPGTDLTAWIAGESAMVTGLRRALVTELGLDRRQVAFMGYWRRGVAMRG